MYLEYFSLKRHPFRITPDPSLFYSGGTHGRGVVLDALIYGITTGEGILKVVGEVGSGKTMLCRMLEERLPDDVEIVYIANPNLTAKEIIYAIAFELRLDVDASSDRLIVMQKLQDYLLDKHANGRGVVVFIEEAQGMPLETLEEIRLLSNLETHRHKLMQIVLFGQPELDRKLQLKSIRQLRERITHSFNLQPLDTEAVKGYLRFRLQAAGCPWPHHLFSPGAEKLLARASGGLTRRINILADKSLLAAYADPSTRAEPRNSAGFIQPMVLRRHVRAAIKDSGYGLGQARFFRYAAYALAGTSLVLMLAFGMSYFFDREPGSQLALTNGSGPESRESESEITQINGAQTSVGQTPEPVIAGTRPASIQEESAAFVSDPVVQEESGAGPAGEEEIPPQFLPTPEPAAPVSAQMREPADQAKPESALPGAGEEQNRLALNLTESDPDKIQEPSVSPEPADPVDTGASESIQTESPASIQTGQSLTAESEPASDAERVTGPAISDRSPESIRPDLDEDGLIAMRYAASADWAANSNGYTVQLMIAPATQESSLEEFLQFLEVSSLVEDTYVCYEPMQAQGGYRWLVYYGEFNGVSVARNFIQRLPPYVTRHNPFVLNLSDLDCNR